MKHLHIITSILLFAPACWAPNIPGDSESVGDGDGDPGDGDGETSTGDGDGDGDGDEPLPDMPAGDGDGDGDGDPDPGWCCTCDGEWPLACTPSSDDECTAADQAWCLLDLNGNPSDCIAQCEATACTCDCDNGGPSAGCNADEAAACDAGCGLNDLPCCNLEGVWGPCDVPQSVWCEDVGPGHPQQCIEACA